MKLHIGGRDFIQYFMLFHNFKKLEMKMLASKSMVLNSNLDSHLQTG